MKTTWRYLFIGAALFVIIVSYKILEPELFRTEQQLYVVNKEPFEAADAENAQPILEDSLDHHRNAFPVEYVNQPLASVSTVKPEPRHLNASMNEVVSAMVNRYLPKYSQEHLESQWKVAANWVKSRQIHPYRAQELGDILKAMTTGRITAADFGVKGTQLKLTLTIEENQQVVFKPAWYTRDYVVTGLPYAGRDRHNAEIAAFHLGRLLELRRTPLAVGRRVNIHKEIIPVATDRLMNTFYEKDGESCFYGRCVYCKGPDDGVCATNGVLEGTIVLWLPPRFKMILHKHPWSRTYRDNFKAKWEVNDFYCQNVKSSSLFNSGPRLLDIIDTCVFDYLIGNADRHHYETFEGHEDSMLIILDNGKSFGNPELDEITILAPLYQCCQIRASLWRRLLALQDGVLSKVLEGVLSFDPISPILTEAHLEALDRRLKTILDEVQKCISKVGINAIVMDSLPGS